MAWWDRFTPRDDPEPPGGLPPDSDLARFAVHEDPWARLHAVFSQRKMWGQLFLAADRAGDIITTTDRRHCLILGPPRCFKSTGILAPQVMCAPGPVVSTSTKPDMYRATAVVRSRVGNLWHLSLDEDGTLPGCIPLRWSPVTASTDWGKAQAAGYGMADATEVGGGMVEGNYFRQRSGALISCLLHAAALSGRDMAWLISGVNGSEQVLSEAQRVLERDGHFLAPDLLNGIVSLDPRSRDAIFSTAQTALVAYQDPHGYDTTVEPNFDPDAFVAGQPDALNFGTLTPSGDNPTAGAFNAPTPGLFDTIYITAPTGKQRRLAPLITALLGAIKEATFRRYARFERGLVDPTPPVFFALDECAAIAPLTDLPETAAQGAGQGLLMSVVLQDLAQAERRWKEESKSFGSLFGDKVIFPGIENRETLQAFSELYGRDWIARDQHGTQQGRDASSSVTHLEELLPRLEPGDIARGSTSADTRNLDPRRVLVSKQGGLWDWAYSLPYFNSPPFAHALVASMHHHAVHVSGFERRYEVQMPKFHSDTTSIEANFEHAGQGLMGRFEEVQAALRDREPARRDVQPSLRKSPLLKGWVADLPFQLATSEFRRSLLLFDRLQDPHGLLEGLPLDPAEPWPAAVAPDQCWRWDLEDVVVFIGVYTSPNKLWELIVDFETVSPGLGSKIPFPPAYALVLNDVYSVGEVIARRIDPPLLVTPGGLS